MKRLKIFYLLLTVILTGCGNPAQSKIEYKKISPQEAQAMITGDVIVLDVRTQEEFDEFHIPNAVLLPDYEVREKAENVLTDKNQTILVYCKRGIRSEKVSRELIKMGYTKFSVAPGFILKNREKIRSIKKGGSDERS